ncbi:hypothetical protein F5X99DRAFT_388252, partial [Biscogniauxia marginata]
MWNVYSKLVFPCALVQVFLYTYLYNCSNSPYSLPLFGLFFFSLFFPRIPLIGGGRRE